jgi:hypothetical protein
MGMRSGIVGCPKLTGEELLRDCRETILLPTAGVPQRLHVRPIKHSHEHQNDSFDDLVGRRHFISFPRSGPGCRIIRKDTAQDKKRFRSGKKNLKIAPAKDDLGWTHVMEP